MLAFDQDMAFLLLSDNAREAGKLVAPHIATGLKIVIAAENPVMPLHPMSRRSKLAHPCRTFSFWGAYPDPRQPCRGLATLPLQVMKDHMAEMIPCKEWEVPSDD